MLGRTPNPWCEAHFIHTYIAHSQTDGRKLSIPINDLVTPAYEKRIPHEGMPNTKEKGQKGDLVLRFNIQYPSSLSDEQKALVRQALG